MRGIIRRRGLGALVAGSLSVVLALGIGAAPGAGADDSATLGSVPAAGATRASGLPWSSGVTPVDISGAEAVRFGTKRGAAVDNVVVYPGRESWTTLVSAFWYQALPSYFDPARDDAVVSVPLWPATNGVRNTGTGEQWQALGSVIAAADPDAYVRLGWEMDLTSIYWALTPRNEDVWVESFRRAVRLLQTTCPGCRIVWNPNHGETQIATRPAFLRVQRLVDVYAIDSYDIYPAIKDPASMREHLGKPGNLDEAFAFARRHGKKFAVPEWGLACNGPGCFWRGHAGGDNPEYIRTYVRWFARHSRSLAFESYFEEATRQTRSALFTRPMGHRSGRAYRAELERRR